MKLRFFFSISFGIIWLLISFFFAIIWAREISCFLPAFYVWWTIAGIALLPGFLMSAMFLSNIIFWRIREYADTKEDITILICARNEEKYVEETIERILYQTYRGHIHMIVIDNGSVDGTKEKAMKFRAMNIHDRSLEYVYCETPGKSNALNLGLTKVSTRYFITVDADTRLEKQAVQKIMNHIAGSQSACVAGNLLVENAKASVITRMQNYDYLLSIAAVKRFQGSYGSTLVAQGAFSAFETEKVRQAGGWKQVIGEDIVLTYALLQKKLISSYEPAAVGYTIVPETFEGLYNQRKRWAMGMIEGLSEVYPWRKGRGYFRYFTLVNCSVIYLDLAYLYGLIPGIMLALFGYYFFAGLLTLFTVAICILFFSSMYFYQRRLHIPFQNSVIGFFLFLLFFQAIQSSASLHGYLIKLLHRKGEWK